MMNKLFDSNQAQPTTLSQRQWNKLQIEGKFKFRENKDGEKFYGIDLAVSSYAAFISMCYLLNKEYIKADEDSNYVL